MNYLNLEIIDISLVVRIDMVDKSVCKWKKNMCEKRNSGYEKEKFVLLSWKKRKRIDMKRTYLAYDGIRMNNRSRVN